MQAARRLQAVVDAAVEKQAGMDWRQVPEWVHVVETGKQLQVGFSPIPFRSLILLTCAPIFCTLHSHEGCKIMVK